MNPLFKPFLFFVIPLSLFISCDREEEKIPSYLRINSFTLISVTATQGLNTSDISSIKVFVNGAEIGNFELPALVPVLKEGNADIELYPNVKENAQSGTQKYFLPYTAYKETVFLEPGKVITIDQAKTEYRANTKFRWIEDFDDQGVSLVKSGANNSNDSILIIPTNTAGVNQPFTGSSHCGYINVSTDSFAIFERSTIDVFSGIPNLGADVYLEMDIKSNVYFQVGIYTDFGGQINQIPVLVVNPTGDTWKKIYVNLKPETGGLITGTKIRIFFGFYKEDGDTEDKKVYLDNLKLLHL